MSMKQVCELWCKGTSEDRLNLINTFLEIMAYFWSPIRIRFWGHEPIKHCPKRSEPELHFVYTLAWTLRIYVCANRGSFSLLLIFISVVCMYSLQLKETEKSMRILYITCAASTMNTTMKKRIENFSLPSRRSSSVPVLVPSWYAAVQWQAM